MGRKKMLTQEQIEWAYSKCCMGYTQQEVADALFVSRALMNREMGRVRKSKVKEPLKYEGSFYDS